MIHQQTEDIITSLADMTRAQLVELLRTLPLSFKLDFTDEFLAGTSTDRLRHIALAASLRRIDRYPLPTAG